MLRILLSGILTLLCIGSVSASPVKLETDAAGHWQFLVDGKPFRVHGIGRGEPPELARQCGVNTLRSYSSGRIPEARKGLDRASENGFKVIQGIWVQRESKPFSYKNPEHLQKQRDNIRRQVRELRDHSAILCWGLGNEAEGPSTKELRPEFWQELNVLAGIVKEEDPDHPVMTVIAGNSVWKLKAIKELAPNIEIIGINTYGGAGVTAGRLNEAGWDGPWILAEFGPRGHWEVPKTDWGVPIEPDGESKAANYEFGYRAATADAKRCLGTIAFVWGSKQEVTGTWYGMFLETGEKTASVDRIGHLYSGTPLPNLSPVIEQVVSELEKKRVAPSATFEVKAVVTDPENDPLAFEWKVIRESGVKWAEGNHEPVPSIIPDCFPNGSSESVVTVRTPDKPGAYRLFLFVRDGKGSAATRNLPFLVVAE